MTVLLGSNSATSSGNDNSSDGNVQATKVTAASTGTVDTISVRFNSSNALSGTFLVAIYDATGSGGGPGARVGNSVNLVVTSGATQYFTSDTGVGASVTSGTTYWIALLLPFTTGVRTFVWDNATGNGGSGGTTGGLVFVGGHITTLASTFPAFSLVAETINAYAESSSAVDNTTKPALAGMFTPLLNPQGWF